MDNVKTDGLQKVLTSGVFIETIIQTAGEIIAGKSKMRQLYLGEKLSGRLSGGSLLSSYLTKCDFFNGGYYEKYCKAMDGWKNLNPI